MKTLNFIPIWKILQKAEQLSLFGSEHEAKVKGHTRITAHGMELVKQHERKVHGGKPEQEMTQDEKNKKIMSNLHYIIQEADNLYESFKLDKNNLSKDEMYDRYLDLFTERQKILGGNKEVRDLMDSADSSLMLLHKIVFGKGENKPEYTMGQDESGLYWGQIKDEDGEISGINAKTANEVHAFFMERGIDVKDVKMDYPKRASEKNKPSSTKFTQTVHHGRPDYLEGYKVEHTKYINGKEVKPREEFSGGMPDNVYKYINKIKNTQKKNYAIAFWGELMGEGEAEIPEGLGGMGAQAVRMQLHELKDKLTKPTDKKEQGETKENEPKLQYMGTVKVDQDTKMFGDKRFKVDRHTAEYRDSEGNIYRKTFNVKSGEKPNIPETGTHDELNALKEQLKKAVRNSTPIYLGLFKGGEGSRGGKVIGHTKSGKPIYADKKADEYANFTKDDHVDAANHHTRMSMANLRNPQLSRHHNQMATSHHDKYYTKPPEAEEGYREAWQKRKAELKKGGEGSRGGKIIGHTKSGKPIYLHEPTMDSYINDIKKGKFKNWTKEDHADAYIKLSLSHHKLKEELKKKEEMTQTDHDENNDHLNNIDTHWVHVKHSGGFNNREQTDNFIADHYNKNYVKKSLVGEGSRGGKVMGHTRSGKPIYDTSLHPSHEKFTPEEHRDAHKVYKEHGKEYVNRMSQAIRDYHKKKKEGAVKRQKKEKPIDKLLSGKKLYRNFDHPEHKDFTPADHYEASIIHSRIANHEESVLDQKKENSSANQARKHYDKYIEGKYKQRDN